MYKGNCHRVFRFTHVLALVNLSKTYDLGLNSSQYCGHSVLSSCLWDNVCDEHCRTWNVIIAYSGSKLRNLKVQRGDY